MVKNSPRIGFGRVLGSIVGGSGLSGASLGRFGALLGGHLALQNLAFVKHWPKMVSKKLFGSILEGFGEGSGRIWEGLGRILADFWVDFNKGRISTRVLQAT